MGGTGRPHLGQTCSNPCIAWPHPLQNIVRFLLKRATQPTYCRFQRIAITMYFMALVKSIPSPLGDFSHGVLEWDRFLALLAGYSVSLIGKKWILSLRPSMDRGWLDRQHSLV